MQSEVFEAVNITKKYGSSYALNQISMSIRQGEIYGLIGENGAGKTTLMKVIGGVVKSSSGVIKLFGKKSVQEQNINRKRIGFLIEMPALYPDMTAIDNLEFYCKLYGIKDEERKHIVLNDVSLEYTSDKLVGEFSLGMKQRLGIAIALLNKPEFLVLDEPTNGLDPTGIAEIRELLRNLAQEQQIAILISSHILSELQMIAHRFGFIHNGKMLKEVSSKEIDLPEEKWLSIQVTDVEKAAIHLKEEFRNQQIKVYKKNNEIRISMDGITIEKVITLLVSRESHILNISLISPSLESYYMNLIGGK